MFRILDASEAAKLIEDNAVIALNSFAAMANPEKLHDAIALRFHKTGHRTDRYRRFREEDRFRTVFGPGR